MRLGLAAVVAALLICVPDAASRAQDLSEARKGAVAGDARSQRIYGQMLLKDTGARADPREGIRWLAAAAEQGDALARRDLANAYLNGTGVPKNPREAISWFRKASESGDSISQSTLAGMLADGKLAPKDEKESAKWMRAAADQGDSSAQLALGDYYRKGFGVEKDLLQAYVWASLASRARNPKASDVRREIVQQLSADQRRVGDRLVQAWGAARVAAKAVEASAKPTGTGFFVSASGHILTNEQAVRGCRELRIRRPDQSVGVATLVAQSPEEDLAVLKSDFRADIIASFSTDRAATQGETVVAYGFALSGPLASAGNLVSGRVTALAGLDRDNRFLQTSITLQPGSGGSPLLDMNARVVGVTTASFGAQQANQASGGGSSKSPNLAVKVEAAAAFLAKHGVAFSVTGGAPRTATAAEEVGARAKRFTVRVECLA